MTTDVIMDIIVISSVCMNHRWLCDVILLSTCIFVFNFIVSIFLRYILQQFNWYFFRNRFFWCSSRSFRNISRGNNTHFTWYEEGLELYPSGGTQKKRRWTMGKNQSRNAASSLSRRSMSWIYPQTIINLSFAHIVRLCQYICAGNGCEKWHTFQCQRWNASELVLTTFTIILLILIPFIAGKRCISNPLLLSCSHFVRWH